MNRRACPIPRSPVRRLPALLLIPLLLPGVAAAQPDDRSPGVPAGPPLDLAACIQEALAANPDLQARQALLAQVATGMDEAAADRYPTLGLSGNAARSAGGGADPTGRHEVGIALRQTLYRGGRVEAAVDIAASAHAAARADLEAVTRDLVFQVRQAWYRLAQARYLLVSAEQSLERSRLHLDYAEALIEAGMGARTDLLRARVDVAGAELDRTRALNQVRSAEAALNTVMGRPPGQALETAAEPLDGTLPPAAPWEALQASALGAREEFAAARARRARQEASLRSARGAYLPVVQTDAGVSRGGTSSTPARESWSVGLSVAVPLFEGFANRARVAGQQALLEAVDHDLEALRQQIAREVWEAVLAEEEAAGRLHDARALREDARENLEAAAEAYRLGARSMIDLVDARTAFAAAEQLFIQAVFDQRIARAALERAVGADPSTLRPDGAPR